MLAYKPFLRWVFIHLLAFFCIPFIFAFSGFLTAALLSVAPAFFGVPDPLSSGSGVHHYSALYLLAPFLTGLLLGALVSWLHILAMRSARVNFNPSRWLLSGMFGLALAALAFAWTYSSPVFLYPLLMAALFSACVYGLVTALPQSRLLRDQAADSWRWLLFCLLAALLAFPLAFASVWLPESPGYLWWVFLLAAAGGVLFGLLTGIVSRNWPEIS
jgi:hypothetical protein